MSKMDELVPPDVTLLISLTPTGFSQKDSYTVWALLHSWQRLLLWSVQFIALLK